jgi:prepilin-type N-terminal cleavage/methylation domain-containing protein
MKKLKNKGFTLIELMVVILIVGILGAVAIPKFMAASHKAKASEFPTVLSSIYTAEHAYQAESGSYSNDFATIDIDPGTVQSQWFVYSIPTATTSTFVAQAAVTTAFGKAQSGQTAQINQSGQKTVEAGLSDYAKTWHN